MERDNIVGFHRPKCQCGCIIDNHSGSGMKCRTANCDCEQFRLLSKSEFDVRGGR